MQGTPRGQLGFPELVLRPHERRGLSAASRGILDLPGHPLGYGSPLPCCRVIGSSLALLEAAPSSAHLLINWESRQIRSLHIT